MVKSRLELLPLNLLALVGLIALGASASSSPSPSARDSKPSPSPSAEVELICHTDDPAECYPKVFQATDEFQVVHDDQDLPFGLHVRLNIYTGKKEAKINIPDEQNPALEGLAVDSSVVLVDRDETSDNSGQVRIPANAPAYDPAGKIKKPPSSTPDEGNAFYKSLTILKKGLDVDEALEMLEEISHDIYYGLKIAEDYDTIRELFCLSTARSPSSSPSDNNSNTKNDPERSHTRARLASLTLASAVQNNPKALSEITRHWTTLADYTCPSPKHHHHQKQEAEASLGESTFHLLPHSPTSPGVLKARISSLSGLLKSPLIRSHFLTARGPSHLLELLTSPLSSQQSKQEEEEEWGPTRRAAALLLLDNFLDADMGAAVGEWPTAGQLSDAECAAAASEQRRQRQTDGSEYGENDEGCWDWRVARFAERYAKDKGHWSHELRDKIREQRRANLARLKGAGAQERKGKEEL
ncbi:hypothetical protein N656DRAFT_840967 [Canariomyces notabilis]|uniref:Nucleotide exchange factor SIL1 n=1 Tax=Canariomyces notabilis TaxID=2074819 RepID=A0AAN6TMJ8_9PEZI|nr:hypothetical protein N656DRAFT_840967 [Canariomyces arenarius]